MGLSKYSTDRFRDHDVHQSRILTVGLCGTDAPVEEGPGFYRISQSITVCCTVGLSLGRTSFEH